MSKQTFHGRRIIFARGMSIEASSEHIEWLDELQRRATTHDELLAALREAQMRLADLVAAIDLDRGPKIRSDEYIATKAREADRVIVAAIAKATGESA